MRGLLVCEHQRGRELGLGHIGQHTRTTAAPSSANKPKVLTGLDQKVSGQVGVFLCHPTQTLCHRCTGGA